MTKKTTHAVNLEIVNALTHTAAVMAAVSTLHVDVNAARVAVHVCANVARFETARPRDVFYFVAACVSRHYANRAAYSVAARAAS